MTPSARPLAPPECRECGRRDMLRPFDLMDGTSAPLCPTCLAHYRDSGWLAEDWPGYRGPSPE